MNRYPLWKYILILVIIVVSGVYALPNLYGEDPALQVSLVRGEAITTANQQRVKEELDKSGLHYKSIAQVENRLLVRFSDTDTQLEAQDSLKKALGNNYVVALNLAPSTPGWLSALGAVPMYLGLDLRGGVHFLMQVDMATAVRQAEERYVSDLRALLRQNKIRYLSVKRQRDGGLQIRFRKEDDRTRANQLIHKKYPELMVAEGQDEGRLDLNLHIRDQDLRDIRKFALEQNITTLRNRVNELGVAEPVIQQQGADRIVVQLPGVQDTARAKEILGATATLDFRLVDEQHDVADAQGGRPIPGAQLFQERDGTPILLKKSTVITGDSIIDAASGLDQSNGSPAVFITLDAKGARMMSDISRDNVGKLMAVVYKEIKSETRQVNGEPVKVKRKVEEVINVARIQSRLGKRFQITGLESTNEARDLALLLRAGALSVPIDIVEERTVGPSMGKENIEQGFRSVVIGFVVVLAFMALWYKGFGLVANLALALNLVIIVALLSMLQATLTMPGIAGIVLTVGMAVDANVLIFERIREELRNGNTPQASIHAGYEKAFSTIADANITTLIAAVVLYGFGTGPIKGFAVTLSIGILTSMFTAIMGTRGVINLLYGGRRVDRLSV